MEKDILELTKYKVHAIVNRLFTIEASKRNIEVKDFIEMAITDALRETTSEINETLILDYTVNDKFISVKGDVVNFDIVLINFYLEDKLDEERVYEIISKFMSTSPILKMIDGYIKIN